MPLTMTARRTLAARQIRIALAEAETELAASPDQDRKASLEALIEALQGRLNNRRTVVMAARQASLARGIQRRRARYRSSPVWGFPTDYNPNLMGDRCDICRSISWTARVTQVPDTVAWTCTVCPTIPSGIPQE